MMMLENDERRTRSGYEKIFDGIMALHKLSRLLRKRLVTGH